MTRMTLAQANTLIGAALEHAGATGVKPLCVVVVDAGGHLLALQRQDGASLLRPQIALAKASGALALGLSTRSIADMAAARPSFVSAVGQIAPNGLVPTAGGVILVDAEGAPIGAAGASGDTPDNDEACVLAGAAAGLTAQA